MESFCETRGGDRIRRAENDGNHPPLRPVELDPHGQGFKPFTGDYRGLGSELHRVLERWVAGERGDPGSCSDRVRLLPPRGSDRTRAPARLRGSTRPHYSGESLRLVECEIEGRNAG